MPISNSMKLGSRKSISGERSFQRLVLFTPAFFIATGLLFAGYRAGNGRYGGDAGHLPDAEPQSKVDQISFRLVASGRAGKKGALNVSFNSYMSSDNILVYYSIESYDSKESAQAEMENMVKHANKTVEEGKKNTPNGKLIGEMAVLVATCTLTARKAQTVVVWTDQSKLAVLCSQSKRHALDFEEQVYSIRPRAD
jgi:hypothetical protein